MVGSVYAVNTTRKLTWMSRHRGFCRGNILCRRNVLSIPFWLPLSYIWVRNKLPVSCIPWPRMFPSVERISDFWREPSTSHTHLSILKIDYNKNPHTCWIWFCQRGHLQETGTRQSFFASIMMLEFFSKEGRGKQQCTEASIIQVVVASCEQLWAILEITFKLFEIIWCVFLEFQNDPVQRLLVNLLNIALPKRLLTAHSFGWICSAIKSVRRFYLTAEGRGPKPSAPGHYCQITTTLHLSWWQQFAPDEITVRVRS